MSNTSFSQCYIPSAELADWRRQLPASARLVLTNGCFDLLHLGHVRYLKQARDLGDLLIVGLNSDVSVRSLKGPERPLNPELARAEVLAALACVDFVTIFSEATADELIAAVHPAVYTKAGDYSLENLPERETVRKLGIETIFLPFVAGHSTTALAQKIQDKK